MNRRTLLCQPWYLRSGMIPPICQMLFVLIQCQYSASTTSKIKPASSRFVSVGMSPYICEFKLVFVTSSIFVICKKEVVAPSGCRKRVTGRVGHGQDFGLVVFGLSSVRLENCDCWLVKYGVFPPTPENYPQIFYQNSSG